MDINFHYSEFYKEVTMLNPQIFQMGKMRAFSFNGNPQKKGTEEYEKKIGVLLTNLKNCLISQDELVLNRILKELQKIEFQDSCKDITEEEAAFVKSVINVQKNAVEDAETYICSLLGIVPETRVKTSEAVEQPKELINPKNPNIIEGIEGLAAFLHIGKTKATELSKSKLFAEHKIRFKAGRGVRFYKDKLDELIKNNPNALQGSLEKNP